MPLKIMKESYSSNKGKNIIEKQFVCSLQKREISKLKLKWQGEEERSVQYPGVTGVCTNPSWDEQQGKLCSPE